MTQPVLNADHLGTVLAEALERCRHRLLISTADVKDLHVPPEALGRSKRSRAASIIDVFEGLSKRGIEIRLLHSGVPTTPVLRRLKKRRPDGLTMRRCPRVHAKVILVDGRWMYLGSANLTGAGLGAKSPRRRNFEAGIWTDDLRLIDPVGDMLESIWDGSQCADCGRKDHCPVPLEEADL